MPLATQTEVTTASWPSGRVVYRLGMWFVRRWRLCPEAVAFSTWAPKLTNLGQWKACFQADGRSLLSPHSKTRLDVADSLLIGSKMGPKSAKPFPSILTFLMKWQDRTYRDNYKCCSLSLSVRRSVKETKPKDGYLVKFQTRKHPRYVWAQPLILIRVAHKFLFSIEMNCQNQNLKMET